MRIINLATGQKKSPSDVLHIEDEYAAFCFDEACNYIIYKMKDGEAPVYETKVKSMSDFYAGLGAS